MRAMPARLSRYVVLGLFAGLLLALIALLSPFAGALTGAFALSLAFYPLHQAVARRLPRWSSSWHAAVSDALILCLLILPFTILVWMAVEESEAWAPAMRQWQAHVQSWKDGRIVDTSSTVHGLGLWANRTLQVRPSQFRQQIMTLADGVLGGMEGGGAVLAKGLLTSSVDLFVMVIALFFFLRDGSSWYSYLKQFFPMPEDWKNEFKVRIRQTVSVLIRGWFLCAAFQGVAATLGYLLAGVQGAVLLGLMTAIAGLIPSIGTALVWLPLAIYQMTQGNHGAGVFILLWGTLVVGLIDNFLRPYFIGRDVKLPFFFFFIALMGGFAAWGIKGIIVGPVLVAVAPVILDMFRQSYLTAPAASAPKTHLHSTL